MSVKTMGLETQLIERTVEKRNAIIARAEERAKKIIDTAKEEVERIKEESERQVLALVDSELRAVRDRIVGRVNLEGRKMVMMARQEMVSKVFEEAEKRLTEIVMGKEADYGEILTNLIVEAVTAMGEEEFIVLANKRDLEYLKNNIKKIKSRVKKVLDEGSVKFDEKHIDIMGGVVVRNMEGTKTYNNTMEGRLVKARGRIEAEVAKVLGVI